MVRKVFKTGNSMVISLPREMVERLQLNEGSEVSIELDEAGRRILIAPVQPANAGVDAEFARQVADFIETYRPALEALAR
jgi:antitoxin MazE